MKRRFLPAKDRERIKDEILGKDYELSFVFASPPLSKKLNRIYRGKDKPANVLSFPLSKNSGEIFIDLATAKKEAEDFGMTLKQFSKFLFIHGLLHLKGLSHGAKMKQTEKKLLKKFL